MPVSAVQQGATHALEAARDPPVNPEDERREGEREWEMEKHERGNVRGRGQDKGEQETRNEEET